MSSSNTRKGEVLEDGNWTMWYMARTNKHSQSANTYENYVNPISPISSTEDFCRLWSHVQRPSALPVSTDLHIFREGVKPVWEDASNEHGGRWTLRLLKGVSDRVWEHLAMALVGGQFKQVKGLCGVVLGVRYQEDVLSVWTMDALDVEGNVRIKEQLLHVLQLPANTVMEYKPHETASVQPK